MVDDAMADAPCFYPRGFFDSAPGILRRREKVLEILLAVTNKAFEIAGVILNTKAFASRSLDFFMMTESDYSSQSIHLETTSYRAF